MLPTVQFEQTEIVTGLIRIDWIKDKTQKQSIFGFVVNNLEERLFTMDSKEVGSVCNEKNVYSDMATEFIVVLSKMISEYYASEEED